MDLASQDGGLLTSECSVMLCKPSGNSEKSTTISDDVSDIRENPRKGGEC